MRSDRYVLILKTVVFCIISGIFILSCGYRPSYTIDETIQERTARLEKFHAIIPPGGKPVPLLSKEHIREKPGRREGPSWWNGKLYFTDQRSGVYSIESDGSCKHFALEKGVGTKPLPSGNLAVCTWRMPDFMPMIVELAPDGSVAGVLAEKFEGTPLGLPNDLVTDNKGGLYFSDPWGGNNRVQNKLPGTAFYYRRPDGEIIRVCGWNEYGFPNGCVLTPDGTRLYINDSADLIVWIYDVNMDGSLSNKRAFGKLIPHEDRLKKTPVRSESDGMALDRSGNLFVAAEIGVHVFDTKGTLLGIIEFPEQPSHCVFGGDNLSTLYVTALNQVYSIRTRTKGYQYPIR